MSYESYDPYEPYDESERNQGYPGEQQQPYYGEQQQYEGQQQPPYPEQQYEQSYEGGYQEPYQEQQSQQQDQQWAQSGLGWEQHAWDEARLGASPLQEPGHAAYPYTQVNELSGTDFQQYQADLPRDLPVPDYPPQYPPQYDEYGPGTAAPSAGRGRRGRAPQTPEYDEHGENQQYAADPDSGDDAPEFPHQRSEAANSAVYESDSEPEPERAKATTSTKNTAPPTAPGRGSFGAAGIGVLAAVAAIASSGALLVVVALIQGAIAFGWQQAVGARDGGKVDRRAVALTALTGWAATAAVYKLSLNSDYLGIPVTMGVGFLLLAADQMMRRGRELGDGERVADLAVAVTGGLFTVLPAGFVVSERTDSALTAACASAAALGVLCCALLGRNPLRGIMVGLVFGAGVGAYAAKTLQANGGLEAGAVGGAVAALAAAAVVGAFDRIVAEAEARGSTKIVSQVLPVALAAVGALIASAVFR